MRKLVYPLVAALCLFANCPNCLAQSDAETATAQSQYVKANSWYGDLKKQLKGFLATKQNNRAAFNRDVDAYNQVTNVLTEQNQGNVARVLALQQKYPIRVVYGKTYATPNQTKIDDWAKALTTKYGELNNLRVQIDRIP